MIGDKTSEAIHKVIADNAVKHGGDNWEQRNPRLDLLKAIRHVSTFMLILDGLQPDDGENHLELALTRLAMAYDNLY